MAEFGQKGRNQTRNPQGGFTGVQVKESKTRIGINQDAPVDGPSAALSQGAEALAGSISNIAEVAKQSDRKDTTNRLALKASALQGTKIAVNDVAQEKKRNPFMAAVFGQTVTSQVSESQSIVNATQALANHAQANMSKLAEMSTEDAINALTDKSEDLVSQIEDPQMRDIAMDSLLSKMPDLAQAHYKERYALERNKQIENNREHIVNNLTDLKFKLKSASGAEAKNAAIDTYAETMFDNNDPLGLQQDELSKAEYRTLVLGQMDEDLQNGDKTLYDVARRIQESDKRALTQTELDNLKNSEGKYDGYQNTMADQVMATASLGLLGAESYAEYDIAANQARQDLRMWTLDGTQSEIDVKNQLKRKAQLERMIKSGAGAWATNAENTKHLRNVRDWGNGNVNQRAQMRLTTREKDIAADAQIDQMITSITGWNTEKATEAMDTVFIKGLQYIDNTGTERFMSPIQVAQNLTQRMKTKGLPAGGFIKRFVDAQLDGMAIGRGEKGKKYTDQQAEQFRVTEALVQGNPSIGLSQDDLTKFEFMRWGFNSKADPDRVQEMTAAWQNNKGKDMSGMKTKDVTESVRNIVKRTGEKYPSDSMMSVYRDQYGDILRSVNFNHKIADSIFTSTLSHGSTSALGIHIPNGKALNTELGDYDLDTLLTDMSTLQRGTDYGDAVSLATPMLMTMFGTMVDKDQKILKDIRTANIIGIEFIPGDTAVTFTGTQGTTARVPMTELIRYGEEIDREKKIQEQVSIKDRLMDVIGFFGTTGTTATGLPSAADLAKQAEELLEVPK